MATAFVRLICLCSVIVLFNAEIEAQDWESPCPRLFVYDSARNTPSRWYGIITLLSDSDLTGVWLRVRFDSPSIQLGNYFGEVKRKNETEYLIKNRDYTLLAHSPKIIEFYLKYDSNKPPPKLVGFRLNAKEICPEYKPSVEITTSIPHLYVNDDPAPVGPVSPINNRGAIGRYTGCGKTSMTRAAPLILYGQNSTEGEWPWHAAIYKNEAGALKYICGGSIISAHFILTAAHCVTDLSTGYALNPSNFLVYVGTADLKDFPSSTQTLQLSRIHAHPDFSRANFHNDIAILQMAIPIDYTAYARPVCVWQGNDDLQSVVGKLGTVVGWGLSENNKISDILKRAEMPIVGTADCIYSKPEFYSKFTSPSSFCAGFRDGTGPCNGDSGSGMVLNKPDGAGGNSWYLRGMVSLSIPLEGKTVCNPNEYIIFTDVAKYVSWIREIVLKPR